MSFFLLLTLTFIQYFKLQHLKYRTENQNFRVHIYFFDNSFIKFFSLVLQQECPEGVVHEECFKDIYAKFFPHGSKYTCLSVAYKIILLQLHILELLVYDIEKKPNILLCKVLQKRSIYYLLVACLLRKFL